MEFANAIIAFTGISFLVYGFNSLTSKRMVNEFKRWGFSKYRKLISFLQILGAIGLILGLKFNLILIDFVCLNIFKVNFARRGIVRQHLDTIRCEPDSHAHKFRKCFMNLSFHKHL